MPRKAFHHLTSEQRCQLYALKARGLSLREIGRQLGVAHTTLSREIARNSGQRGYRYKQADDKAQERRHRARARPGKLTADVGKKIIDMLEDTQASPQQIAGRLMQEHGIEISHETIYRMIWKDRKMGGNLYLHLRHRAKKYNKRSSKNAGRGLIPNRVGIEHRPVIVDEKQRVGDFELDTIIGANRKGALVSIVDRATKYTYLRLVEDRTAEKVEMALVDALTHLQGQKAIHTLTADNGKEFARHQNVAHALEADFYFATPYHSWERGLNEHTNGLVRQYFPKGTDFGTLTQEDVAAVERKINNRPRKCLQYATPDEKMHNCLATLRTGAFQC